MSRARFDLAVQLAEHELSICDKPNTARAIREESAWIQRSHDALLAALERVDLHCIVDTLNPCWDGRPDDVAGKHWGVGEACAACVGRAAIAAAKGTR